MNDRVVNIETVAARAPGREAAWERSSCWLDVEQALEGLRAGQMFILVDEADRENEGDFLMAAEKVTPEAIHFMARHGRGLICAPITEERARQLSLERMVSAGTALHGTNFSVSVDAARGVTTGISASDRAAAVRILVDPDSRPADLARPGHLFPLIAAPEGVLERRGHTEAAVDLARMAGMSLAGVICEILAGDGSVARVPELVRMAEELGMGILAVRDLVEYRLRHEMPVRLAGEVDLPTEFGRFRMRMYEETCGSRAQHLVIYKGELKDTALPLVRVHSECLTGDLFRSRRCDCGEQLDHALRAIEREGRGAVIYLRQEGRGIGLRNKLLAYRLQEQGQDTVEANEALGFAADPREYWAAAAILRHLGVSRVRLLTNNPCKVRELERYGIEVGERIPLAITPRPENRSYLETKRRRLGHLIPREENIACLNRSMET